jgi:hypothetical protein
VHGQQRRVRRRHLHRMRDGCRSGVLRRRLHGDGPRMCERHVRDLRRGRRCVLRR